MFDAGRSNGAPVNRGRQAAPGAGVATKAHRAFALSSSALSERSESKGGSRTRSLSERSESKGGAS
jgi:hypothetical protein